MSTKYLGKTLDIHGGGLENQFPHHECEIAQSEAAYGVPFVRTWLHNNMVTVDGQKMGKSLNNFINLKQAFAGEHPRLTRAYDPLAIRQFILASHYRSPLDFSDAALFAAQSGSNKIAEAVLVLRKALKSAPEGAADAAVTDQLEVLKGRFEEAMNDDLNTAVAVSVVFDLVKLTQATLSQGGAGRQTLQAIEEKFNRLGGDVLGIVGDRQEVRGKSRGSEELVGHLVEMAIEQRTAARKAKDFARSDQIRDKLDQMGIALKDTPQGTQWSFK
jgi:cysteinyl-tRNA synthetase